MPNTRFKSISDQIRARWKPEWNTSQFVPVRRAMEDALAAAIGLEERAAELRKGGRYSAEGLKAEVREAARATAIRPLRLASHALDTARNSLQRNREALGIPKVDRTDLVAALLRSECRGWLRTLSQSDQAAFLLSDALDENTFLAIMEVPGPMTGISVQLRQQVQDHLLKSQFGDELDGMETMQEAIDVASSALETSLVQLRFETQFSERDDEFNQWMMMASKEVEEEILRKRSSGVVADRPAPEPNSYAAIEAEIDAVFARVFPNLYPRPNSR